MTFTAGKGSKPVTADNDLASQYAGFFTIAVTSPEENRLNKWLNDLIEKNAMLGGSINGFILGGKFIDNGGATQDDKVLFRPVVPQLNKEVMAYKQARVALDAETIRMKQSFYTLFFPCKDQQDIRDALPEHVYLMTQMNWDLDRTRPEGFTIPDNPIKKFEHEQLLDLLDLHLSARML